METRASQLPGLPYMFAMYVPVMYRVSLICQKHEPPYLLERLFHGQMKPKFEPMVTLWQPLSHEMMKSWISHLNQIKATPQGKGSILLPCSL